MEDAPEPSSSPTSLATTTLPDELLDKIFSFLPCVVSTLPSSNAKSHSNSSSKVKSKVRYSEQLAHCTLVCRAWEPAASRLLLARARLPGSGNPQDPRAVCFVDRMYGGSNARANSRPNSDDSQLKKPLPQPRLAAYIRSLHIGACVCYDFVKLQRLLLAESPESLPNLQELSLRCVTFPVVQLSTYTPPESHSKRRALEKLRIEYAPPPMWGEPASSAQPPKYPSWQSSSSSLFSTNPAMLDVLLFFSDIRALTLVHKLDEDAPLLETHIGARLPKVRVQTMTLSAWGLSERKPGVLPGALDVEALHELVLGDCQPALMGRDVKLVLGVLGRELERVRLEVIVSPRSETVYTQSKQAKASLYASCPNVRSITLLFLLHQTVLSDLYTPTISKAWRTALQPTLSSAASLIDLTIEVHVSHTTPLQCEAALRKVAYEALDWRLLNERVDKAGKNLRRVKLRFTYSLSDQPAGRDLEPRRVGLLDDGQILSVFSERVRTLVSGSST